MLAAHRVGCTTVKDRVGPSVRSAPSREPAEAAASAPTEPEPEPELELRFGRDEIAVIRHRVMGWLAAAGLAGERLHGFVLAVNEVITNVVLHAGGQGRIALRVTGDQAWCTVTDSGPGIPARYLEQPEVPATGDVGGRGIWLVQQLCDQVSTATGPIGTTIVLQMALPRRAQPA